MLTKLLRFIWEKLGVALFIVFFLAAYLVSSKGLSRPSVQYPYALIAVLSSIMLLLFGREIFGFIKDIKEKRARECEPFWEMMKNGVIKWRRQIMYAGFAILYLILIQLLGYYVSTFLYTLAVAWMMNVKKPLTLLSMGAGTLLTIYAVVNLWLRLSLPEGLLF